jgi:hypothetical protein
MTPNPTPPAASLNLPLHDDVVGDWRQTGSCRAFQDGDCVWSNCPQHRDGEPHKSGRHCPLDGRDDDQ